MAFTSSSLPRDTTVTHAPPRHHQEDCNDGAAMEPAPPKKHHRYQHHSATTGHPNVELSPERRHQQYYYNIEDDRREERQYHHHYPDYGPQNNNDCHKYFPHPGVSPMIPSLTNSATQQQTMGDSTTSSSKGQQQEQQVVGHYHDIDYFFRESQARRNSHNVNPNVKHHHYPSISLKEKHHHRVMSGEDAADIAIPNDLGSVQDFHPNTVQSNHFRPPIYMMNRNNINEDDSMPPETNTIDTASHKKSNFIASIPFGFSNSSNNRRKQWYYR